MDSESSADFRPVTLRPIVEFAVLEKDPRTAPFAEAFGTMVTDAALMSQTEGMQGPDFSLQYIDDLAAVTPIAHLAKNIAAGLYNEELHEVPAYVYEPLLVSNYNRSTGQYDANSLHEQTTAQLRVRDRVMQKLFPDGKPGHLVTDPVVNQVYTEVFQGHYFPIELKIYETAVPYVLLLQQIDPVARTLSEFLAFNAATLSSEPEKRAPRLQRLRSIAERLRKEFFNRYEDRIPAREPLPAVEPWTFQTHAEPTLTEAIKN